MSVIIKGKNLRKQSWPALGAVVVQRRRLA
jgi:hypothetical protein